MPFCPTTLPSVLDVHLPWQYRREELAISKVQAMNLMLLALSAALDPEDIKSSVAESFGLQSGGLASGRCISRDIPNDHDHTLPRHSLSPVTSGNKLLLLPFLPPTLLRRGHGQARDHNCCTQLLRKLNVFRKHQPNPKVV